MEKFLKKFLLYKTNRCQVETKEIILVLELDRMATEALKSQLTFYAGNAVQNGKGVLIRLPSQKSNYKMGNENNKIAEGKMGTRREYWIFGAFKKISIHF